VLNFLAEVLYEVLVDDFYTKFARAVPPHKEMVDAQFRAMDANRKSAVAQLERLKPDKEMPATELRALKEEARRRIAARTLTPQEGRDKIAEVIVQALRGLVYATGDSLYWNKEGEGKIAEGVSFPITKGKIFSPAFAAALFFRVWPVPNKEQFLGHAYDWYVKALATFPWHFRSEEWKLVIDKSGDLFVQLTWKKDARPSHDPNFVRATIIRRRKPRKKKR